MNYVRSKVIRVNGFLHLLSFHWSARPDPLLPQVLFFIWIAFGFVFYFLYLSRSLCLTLCLSVSLLLSPTCLLTKSLFFHNLSYQAFWILLYCVYMYLCSFVSLCMYLSLYYYNFCHVLLVYLPALSRLCFLSCSLYISRLYLKIARRSSWCSHLPSKCR